MARPKITNTPTPGHGAASGSGDGPRRIITLIKGAHHWRFHLEPGGERDMIDAVAGCANDPSHPLDWFDAAIVSHQITRQIETNLPAPPADGPGKGTDAAGDPDRPADAA